MGDLIRIEYHRRKGGYSDINQNKGPLPVVKEMPLEDIQYPVFDGPDLIDIILNATERGKVAEQVETSIPLNAGRERICRKLSEERMRKIYYLGDFRENAAHSGASKQLSAGLYVVDLETKLLKERFSDEQEPGQDY
ncbi:MAG: hypothetical protein KAT35_00575 [Candidatus Aenigmarchaeota archaeon]|nr:hypothetical protein [Candidatus Aenigmarchaeota archaeon]